MNKDFVYNYLNKREAAVPKVEQEKLRNEIYDIKKSAINNLNNLVELAKANLERNGAKVFVVRNRKEAAEKIRELVGTSASVVKAKSNLLDKLDLKEMLGDSLTETDLGAYIVSCVGGDSDHPVLPSIDLTAEEISQRFSQKYGRDYPTEAKSLTDKLKLEIREKIMSADIGLTGANAVTADGQIMLLENEGNISLITRLPKTHIAVCGIEKIVADSSEAAKVAKAAAVWGTGQLQPTYISFIAGPSKTADIENELVVGVQGAQELALILIEGDVYEKIGTELEESLYCIHCGACYNLCATWNLTGKMPKAKSAETIFDCTLCQNCTFNCPAKIGWQNIVRISRSRYNKEGSNTPNNLKMIENVRRFGNPFGEDSANKSPDGFILLLNQLSNTNMKKITKFFTQLGKNLNGWFRKLSDKVFRKRTEEKKQEKFKRGLMIGLGVALVVVIVGLAVWFTWSKVGSKKDAQMGISNPVAEAKVYIVASRKCGKKCWDTQLFLDALTQRNIKIVSTKKTYVGIWPFSLGNSLAKKYNITKVPTVVVEFTGKNKPDITSFFNTNLGVVNDGKFILGKILAPYYGLSNKKIRGLVNVVYLSDKSCADCYDVKKHEVALKNLGVDTKGAKLIDISSNEGKELITKYNITKVPTVLVSGEVNEYQVLAQAWADVGVVSSDGTYIFTNVDLMEGSYKDLKTGQIIKADPNKAVQAATQVAATSTATKK